MRYILVAALLLLIPCTATAGDWAEVDISGYTTLSPSFRIVPTISTVYFFGNKGFGLQYGAVSSEEQQASVLTSWRVWSIYWGPTKTKALHVHVMGRITNDIGETFDFSQGDVGFELRPDFNIDNKVTSSVRLLWTMDKGSASRFTLGLGVQFDIT